MNLALNQPDKRSRADSYDEALCVETESNSNAACFEALIAGFLQKKLQKELHRSGHPPALQEQIDDAKVMEFARTLLEEKRL